MISILSDEEMDTSQLTSNNSFEVVGCDAAFTDAAVVDASNEEQRRTMMPTKPIRHIINCQHKR